MRCRPDQSVPSPRRVLGLTIVAILLMVPITTLSAGEEKAAATDWQREKPARNWKYIVLHHSATSRGDVASIDRSHRRRKDSHGRPWRGIGYHFVIGNGNGMDDGAIEPTFRWREQIEGAHAGQKVYNQFGIGICLIGNFQNSEPTPAQLKSLRQLLDHFEDHYALTSQEILGHKAFRATKCPGQFFPTENFADSES